ncbi:sensor histidine kinase [Vibrio ulleungensis]|uniref:histidine kinase n=1 Tax=Vibrio ulleungensis TaxID=2807619 RepID=A0ABS2HEJ1_9VIBR|nr:ATP-binding protein [Vibrio ulleungensis]MBM7036000.1 HAMP domain-containing protein [Vibrio ulleungensis]
MPDIVAILELKSASNRLFAEIQGFVATGDEGEIDEFYESVEEFNTWLDEWTVAPGDETELELKKQMVLHAEVFSNYAQVIFDQFVIQKQQLKSHNQLHVDFMNRFSRFDSVAHSNGHQQFAIDLYNDVNLLLIETYKIISTHIEDDDDGEDQGGEPEQISAGENEQQMMELLFDQRLESLEATLVNRPTFMPYDPIYHLTETILQSAQQLAATSATIYETLDNVEEYEEEILETLDSAITLQTREVEDSFERADITVSNFTAMFIVMSALFTVVFSIISRQLGQSIAIRMGKLVASIKEISNGNFTNRADVKGQDEIGQLGKYFNEMTDKLETTTVSKDYVNSILVGLNESLVVVSTDGVLETVNQATLALLGYQQHELIGKHYSVLFASECVGEVQEVLQSNASRKELNYVSKEGERIPVLLSSSHTLGMLGEVTGNVCVASDIRQLKIVQSALEESYNELQVAQQQLVQSSKLASIGELSAGVAHELNQPLMIIRTGSQMLERKRTKGTLDDAYLEKFIGSVNANSKRMMKIIDHLRTFARQSSVEYNPMKVNSVIENCFYMIGEQLRLHDIVAEQSLEDNLPEVRGDSNQLEQVVLNLLTNARDAVDENSAEKRVTITTQRSIDKPDHIEILISDNGTGIPVDKQDHVFDPFFTTKEEGKGTGLGLSISYGIIEAHSGTIDVMSTGQQGTTMRIQLPILS